MTKHVAENRNNTLVHVADQGVDLVLAVSGLSALHVVLPLDVHASAGAVELEGPQEAGHVLEVGADSEELVNEVLHADQAELAKVLCKKQRE